MKGSAPPDRSPLTLLTFNSQEDIDGFSLGSDVDVGGYSTIHLDFVPGDAKDPTEKGKGRYWGDMRLDLRPELRGRMRSGYSGIRNKVFDLCTILLSYFLIYHFRKNICPTPLFRHIGS